MSLKPIKVYPHEKAPEYQVAYLSTDQPLDYLDIHSKQFMRGKLPETLVAVPGFLAFLEGAEPQMFNKDHLDGIIYAEGINYYQFGEVVYLRLQDAREIIDILIGLAQYASSAYIRRLKVVKRTLDDMLQVIIEEPSNP